MLDMKYTPYMRIGLLALMLYSFYILGFPPYMIVLFGALGIAIIALRGHAYEKIEKFIGEKYPPYKEFSGIKKKIILIVSFMLIYIILKQILFALLAFMGFDVQKDMMSIISQQP